jgi:hypothetical protein
MEIAAILCFELDGQWSNRPPACDGWPLAFPIRAAFSKAHPVTPAPIMGNPVPPVFP